MNAIGAVYIVIILVLILGFVAYLIAPVRKRIREIGLTLGKSFFSIFVKTEGIDSSGDEQEGPGVQGEARKRGGEELGGGFEGVRDIPLEGKRYLTEEETDKMLGIALQSSDNYPICSHAAVTHAAGSAVARIAARAVWDDVGYLRNQFHTRGGEMLYESEYKKERLLEYICILLALKGIISQRGGRSGGAQVLSANLVSKTLAELPKGSALVYRVIGVQASLEGHIREMKRLLGEIFEREQEIERKEKSVHPKEVVELRQEEKKWQQDKIGSMLKEKGKELQLLAQSLEEVRHDANAIEDSINHGWADNLRQVWETAGRPCQPSLTSQRPLSVPW
ncbi:MAG: hypothetical protein ACYS9T_01750 [Planctomycetota bacterium]|jgi:hypothetical protein